jgi:hypothetical protein
LGSSIRVGCPIFAINKIKGRSSVIHRDGKQVRDAVHVNDVVELLLKQSAALMGERRAQSAGQSYNVGGGYPNTISLLELCDGGVSNPLFRTGARQIRRYFIATWARREHPSIGHRAFRWTRD